jgi:hypothetical protein
MVLQYQGPDEETLSVLRSSHSLWLQDPSSFWMWPATCLADPQAQIVDYYLRTKIDNA